MSGENSPHYENDDGIIAQLEALRKSLIDSRRFLDNKAHQVFMVSNAIATIVITGHILLFQAGERSGSVVVPLAVFGLLYVCIIYLYARIVEPARFAGGLIMWDSESIKDWRSVPPQQFKSQLIAQYQVLCDDNYASLNMKADQLQSMFSVLMIAILVVIVEVVFFILQIG